MGNEGEVRSIPDKFVVEGRASVLYELFQVLTSNVAPPLDQNSLLHYVGRILKMEAKEVPSTNVIPEFLVVIRVLFEGFVALRKRLVTVLSEVLQQNEVLLERNKASDKLHEQKDIALEQLEKANRKYRRILGDEPLETLSAVTFHMRISEAAVKIQRIWRGYVVRRDFLKMCKEMAHSLVHHPDFKDEDWLVVLKNEPRNITHQPRRVSIDLVVPPPTHAEASLREDDVIDLGPVDPVIDTGRSSKSRASPSRRDRSERDQGTRRIRGEPEWDTTPRESNAGQGSRSYGYGSSVKSSPATRSAYGSAYGSSPAPSSRASTPHRSKSPAERQGSRRAVRGGDRGGDRESDPYRLNVLETRDRIRKNRSPAGRQGEENRRPANSQRGNVRDPSRDREVDRERHSRRRREEGRQSSSLWGSSKEDTDKENDNVGRVW